MSNIGLDCMKSYALRLRFQACRLSRWESCEVQICYTFRPFKLDFARCGTQRRIQPTDNMLGAKFFLGELGVGLIMFYSWRCAHNEVYL